jgi:radical SAM superfamily enzyme YgiQ (UPF0313 family)
MYDIVLVSIPYSSNTVPPLGISVLSGVIKSHGYKCKCVDLSMALSKECEKEQKNFESMQLSLVTPQGQIDKFLEIFFGNQIKKILELNPKYIGISVFSFMAHYTAFYLCKVIRNLSSNTKIILGGPGVGTTLAPEVFGATNPTDIEKMIKYGDFLKKRNLADYIIYGDGEEALLELLSTTKINDVEKYNIYNYKQEFPFADFDDYNFDDYQGQLRRGFPQIPVFTSKGCVRNCDFCDVNVIQKKFRFRQGKNVVKELLYLADRYGIRDFNFSDSLINGSLSSMLEWVQELADYNNKNPDKKITWSGSWICRPIGQIKEPVYKLLAESGCSSLAIGAESGSNQVLTAMDKKTNVEALYYEAEQFQKNNINFITLLIVGHWSEHWEDFEATLKMLYTLADYVRSGHYIAVSIGATMGVTKNTPLEQNRSINKLDVLSYFTWWTPLNPGLTAKERYFRLLLIEKFCDYFHLPLMERVLPYVHKTVENEFETMEAFYTRHVGKLDLEEEQLAEFYYTNFKLLVKKIEQQFNENLSVCVEIESQSVNTDPVFEIYNKDLVILSQELVEGQHQFNFDLDQETNTCIKFRLKNKNPFDTIVDPNNNIVKDKFILLKKIAINGINIVNDPEFFNTKLTYIEDDNQTRPKFGLWKNNSELQIAFDGSFKTWYNKNSKKNSVLEADIISEITMSTNFTDEYYRDKLVNLLKKLAC